MNTQSGFLDDIFTPTPSSNYGYGYGYSQGYGYFTNTRTWQTGFGYRYTGLPGQTGYLPTAASQGYAQADLALSNEINTLIALAMQGATDAGVQSNYHSYNAYVLFINHAKKMVNSIIVNPILNQYRPNIVAEARIALNKLNNIKL